MALPGDLNTVVITGSFVDTAGTPLQGTVTFCPSSNLTDSTGHVVVPATGRRYILSGGTFTSDALVATDNATLSPSGWAYVITIAPENIPAYTVTVTIPHSPSPVDLSVLAPAISPVTYASYLPLTGGTMTGPLIASESPQTALEVATKGYVDTATTGLDAKPAVRVATTAALAANSYASGVLTATANGALTVDGVTVAVADRVLVKNESAQANNGLYCLTVDTEILTSGGWKLPCELQGTESVLTVNCASGLAEWQSLNGVHTFDVKDEPMLALEGPAHSSLSTMDHRWVIRDRWKGGLKFQRSRDLALTAGILRSAPCVDLPTEPKYSDALVELVAWFITEGHIRPLVDGRPGKNVRIAQSGKVNAPYVAQIRAALTGVFGGEAEQLGRYLKEPRWCERPNSNGHGLTTFDLNAIAGAALIEHAPNRVTRPEFITALTRSQLHLFVDTCIIADGHQFSTGSTRGIGQKDPARLDAIEMAAILLGFNVNRMARDGAGMTTMHIGHSRKFVQPFGGTRKHASRYHSEVVRHTGQVWCPETPNGTWLARRRGTVYFTGNTVTQTGSGSLPYILTRAADMNSGSEVPGALVLVESGTANTDTGWFVSSPGPFTLGTTAIVWAFFSGGVAIDTTDTPAALGTAAPGAIGKASDAGHVHPTTSIINGVTVSGSPGSGKTIVGTSSSAAAWQTADTVAIDSNSGHIAALAASASAGAVGLAADSGHAHPFTSNIGGVAVSGTAANGKTVIATSSSAAAWTLPLQIDTTATDIQPLGTRSAGVLTQAAAADHVHASTSIIDGVTVSGTPVAGEVMVATSGTAATWQVPQGQLTPTAVKTSAYSANPLDFVPVDTTSGSVTVTLPNAPADLTVLGVKMTILGGSNTVTIAASGSDVFNKSGGSTSLSLARALQTVVLAYHSGIWYVTATDPALSLDTTSGDIAGIAASASAGSVFKAADAGHVHPATQAGMDALAGAVTSGSYLRGSGSHVVMSTIQAADLPTGTTSTKGALQLDGTSGDIAAPAAAASAGAVGKAADAGHVHPLNDPLQIGSAANYIIPSPVNGTGTFAASNAAAYMRLRSGGYATANWVFHIATSSGNISIAAYTNAGSGSSSQPTGGRTATSGAIATPSAGDVTVSLGGSVTPNLGDWAAISCDNQTAQFYTLGSSANVPSLTGGVAWSQTTAHPLPSTPSGLSAAAFSYVYMHGA